jgi:hypothetical protein
MFAPFRADMAANMMAILGRGIFKESAELTGEVGEVGDATAEGDRFNGEFGFAEKFFGAVHADLMEFFSDGDAGGKFIMAHETAGTHTKVVGDLIDRDVFGEIIGEELVDKSFTAVIAAGEGLLIGKERGFFEGATGKIEQDEAEMAFEYREGTGSVVFKFFDEIQIVSEVIRRGFVNYFFRIAEGLEEGFGFRRIGFADTW